MDMENYVSQVRSMVIENRKLWPEMDKADVASYSYLRQFAAGRYDNPGAITLERIERFISERVAA